MRGLLRSGLLFFSCIYLSGFCKAQLSQNDQALAIPATEAKIDSFYVKNLFILGNRITKEQVILRELDFRTGDKIPKNTIDSYLEVERNKVFNTNLFITADILYDVLSKDTVNIRLILKERWYIFPIPLLEIADRNFNEWINNRGADLSRLNYGVYFTQKNFRGRNESLKLRLQFGFNKRFSLKYIVPFLNKRQTTGLTIETGYSESNQIAYNDSNNIFQEFPLVDTDEKQVVYRAFNLGTTFHLRQAFYYTHHLNLQFNHNWVADSVSILNPDFFLDGRNTQKYLQLSYTFERNFKDFSAYPLKGSYLEITFNKTGLFVFNDLNMSSIDFTYSRYLPLSKKFFFASGVIGKVSFPDEQPYDNFKALGYKQNIIRGFDNYVVGGQHIGIWKNTLRFKAFEKRFNMERLMPVDQFNTIPLSIYPKIYFDAGYIKNANVTEQNARLTNKSLWGAGLGLDIITFYNSIFRLEYSYNSFDGFKPFIYFSADI
ncbi:BamA/TamA family outer membrane protein [Rapidithrix thailandica]|uniref:BamA/TamA family outer membrane protein n=1 Tax=Rapidithrix thailandica TaxID=413964 RepID=A0AAW9S9B2_9BACT